MLWVALTLAISSSVEAGVCEWPSVVAFRGPDGKCSGVLLAPQIVATAAHCVVGQGGDMRFGEDFQLEEFRIDGTDCTAFPAYAESSAPSDDLAICRLTEPVEGIPPVPMLSACEAEEIGAGLPAALVGFGLEAPDGFARPKRFAVTEVDSDLRSDGTIFVGSESVSGCLGDSGGPAFVQLPDGTWRTLGVLVFSPDCGEGPSLYVALHHHAAWLEEAAGVDLTPCEGDDATCEGFAVDPRDPATTWDTRCASELSGAMPVCVQQAGSETSSGGGEDPPADDGGSGCSVAGRGSPVWLLWLLLLARSRCRPRSTRVGSSLDLPVGVRPTTT